MDVKLRLGRHAVPTCQLRKLKQFRCKGGVAGKKRDTTWALAVRESPVHELVKASVAKLSQRYGRGHA